jgi:hypothetical protein
LKKNYVSWNDAHVNSKNVPKKTPKTFVHNFALNGDYNNEWDDLQSQFLKYTK